YRAMYDSCHGRYALSAPFTERFWDLAKRSDDNPSRAGYVGLINANSFMKREFGKKLVEGFFPKHDLTHVVDMAVVRGIPDHGTPTLIMFGRGRPPLAETVRAVLGKKADPVEPDDPAKGE